jgi:hypothetical protein
MRLLLVAIFVAVAGCKTRQDKWQTEYYAVGDKWEAAYSGSDASTAYAETLAFANYLKKMQSDGVPFDAAKVLVWVYPRLGLLAEHLGKKEEAQHYFALAVRHARAVHPTEPESKTSEEAFRSALDQMDTPEKTPWRKKPN